MNQRHLAFWPHRRPLSFPIPVTNLALNLKTSAERYPDHPAIVYYNTPIAYGRLWSEVEALAGYLEKTAGVKPGDRVIIDMQNSPQWVIAYYAILRANAVVVPLNPMAVTAELDVYATDSGAKVAFAGQELLDRVQPLAGKQLERVIVAAYSQYVEHETDLSLPPAVAAPPAAIAGPGLVAWSAGPGDDRCGRHGGPAIYVGNDRPPERVRAHPSLDSNDDGFGRLLEHARLARRQSSLGSAVFSCHRHDGLHERGAFHRRDDRHDDALGCSHDVKADRAFPGRHDDGDQHDGRRFARATRFPARAHRVAQAPRRRRCAATGRRRRTINGPPGPAVHGRVRSH